MLFMVIERFRDVREVGERFHRHGRMLPDRVMYHASWIEPDTARCFQLMEAPSRESLDPWLRAWADVMEFEVVPVVTSAEYWRDRQPPSR
jgi:Protein of unknown function (DUF3303)